MKTTLISRISLGVLSMLLVFGSFAQKDSINESAYRFTSDLLIQSFPSVDKNVTGSIKESENISTKTLKHFNKKFHNASNVIW